MKLLYCTGHGEKQHKIQQKLLVTQKCETLNASSMYHNFTYYFVKARMCIPDGCLCIQNFLFVSFWQEALSQNSLPK